MIVPRLGSVLRRAAWFLPLAVAAYGLPCASCWLVLATVGADRFDPHAFGLLGDAVLLLILSPVMLGLAWWVLRRCRPWCGVFAAASAPGWTALSALLLLLLGAPTPEQISALALLPARDAWPVLLSALLWFVVVAAGRALAVAAPHGASGAGR